MVTIQSFTIDHTKLKPGIYVSRYDSIGDNTLTTFDLRFKTPYLEPALTPEAAHTIEHLSATWLRNSERKDEIVYFGPMGCLTGFYLIMKGRLVPDDIKWLFTRMLNWMRDYNGDIPGATEVQCGNCYMNDLSAARKEAKLFLENVVCKLSKDNTQYP